MFTQNICDAAAAHFDHGGPGLRQLLRLTNPPARRQRQKRLAEFAAEEFAVEAVGEFGNEQDFGWAFVAG